MARAGPSQVQDRPVLVVAGMHRSGTSAMARVLSLAGAGLPDRLIGAGPDNPLGFWEPEEMVSLSDALLAAAGSRWDDPFVHRAAGRAAAAQAPFLDKAVAFLGRGLDDQPLPVLKDPRASVLMPFWRDAMARAGRVPTTVVMVRHPLEVAGSIRARDALPVEQGLLAWTGYMLAAERDTRGHARVFVAYEDLLADPAGVLDRIEAALGRPLPDRSPAAAAAIAGFLSRAHRHHEADPRALESAGVWSGCRAVFDWMQAAARGEQPAPAALDRAETELEALAAVFAPLLSAARGRLDAARRAADAEIALRDAQVIRERSRGRELVEAEAGRQAEFVRNHRDFVAHAEAEIADLRAAVGEAEAAVDRAGEQAAAAEARRADAEARLAEREAELAAEREAVQRLAASKQAVFDSLSWRVTRPLRLVTRRLGR